tara:strand:- start:1267 stop:1506 length:240 start_codon:yes stop_codon:yes gene_type:complete
MKELSTYLVDQCKKAQEKKKYDIQNRLNYIEMNNFFKNSGKQELNNKFVACSYYSNITPLQFQWVRNDMSKYKLKNYRK